MSSDATPDPYANPVAFGQRMQILRERRGMTRQVLAGLLGKSSDWVKDLERGRTQAPGVETVYRIASALRVRNLADLTGHPDMHVDLFIGPGHPRLAAVRAAVDSFGPAAEQLAPSGRHIAARLARAWSARHSAPNHREVIGALLPDLIRDAQLAVKHAESPPDWRAAQAVLAEVYSLSQFFLAYQPDSSLLWRVAERSLVAAQQSDDPHAIGVSSWLLTQAHRDSGPSHYDAADAVNLDALAYLNPLLPNATDDVLAIAGALTFEVGYTAARRGETATAWRHWDEAKRMAERLPETYYHPVTSFSQAIMGAHAVTVAVELHAGPESVRQAARADATAIPSRPRRARHRIEQARGYQLDGQPDVAIATLSQAYEAAPETIRYNGYARSIILEEVESKVAARRRRASELAVNVGLLAA
ncbi:helix-turn-helix domain-containing protein [Streptomyces sp. P9(2023)]|uniref:helix-turn-helix domain-containing protein n=1 Tax=Streptomyces sp. P9(2023) TaxID=3064394 RepID=UPI0028F4324D|nr:helix-turn-helix domain-containing protein [Streptomyces sp. P9(2023)]MDT9689185.1 helix-turn-helix domain-containing protein [Streptomyces sp. P9(2023)]